MLLSIIKSTLPEPSVFFGAWVLASTFLVSQPVQSVTVFSLSDTNQSGNTTYSTTNDGITLTLTDNNSSGFPTASFPAGGFFVSDSGIALVDPATEFEGSQFLMSFSQAVVLSGYSVGLASLGTTGATLEFYDQSNIFLRSGQFDSEGTVTFASPLSLNADQSIRVLADYGGAGTKSPNNLASFQIQAVPFESDSMPILGASVLIGGGMWLKRRRKNVLAIAPGTETES